MKMPVDKWLRYGSSKLSNILFMRGLEKRIEQEGLQGKVASIACHPGYAKTQIQMLIDERGALGKLEPKDEDFQSSADGSLPLLMGCLSKDVINGDYLGPSQRSKGLPKKEKVGGYGN